MTPKDCQPVIIDPEPTNRVEHFHDGHRYLYALHNGQLVRAGHLHGPGATVRDGDWRRAEYVMAQTQPVQDPETGEWFEPDPDREAYIAALRTVLQTVEPR